MIEEIHPFILKHLDVNAIKPLHGGDISSVFLINDKTVLKLNRSDEFPGMFEREKQGLELLARTFHTPEVIQIQSDANWQLLELSYIPPVIEPNEFWMDFGRQLALTHQQTTAQFGLDEDNYIGSLKQLNTRCEKWSDFLIQYRLQPMIEMAVNSGEVNYVEAKIIEYFYNRVEEIYPTEPPALIHGDLWSGNYLSGANGPVLIDPAVYYGNREMDIGMMHLFGGFNDLLFESYHEIYPLEKTWKSRIQYNQLYPLLVHLNLFGRSYWKKLHTILKEFA